MNCQTHVAKRARNRRVCFEYNDIAVFDNVFFVSVGHTERNKAVFVGQRTIADIDIRFFVPHSFERRGRQLLRNVGNVAERKGFSQRRIKKPAVLIERAYALFVGHIFKLPHRQTRSNRHVGHFACQLV